MLCMHSKRLWDTAWPTRLSDSMCSLPNGNANWFHNAIIFIFGICAHMKHQINQYVFLNFLANIIPACLKDKKDPKQKNWNNAFCFSSLTIIYLTSLGGFFFKYCVFVSLLGGDEFVACVLNSRREICLLFYCQLTEKLTILAQVVPLPHLQIAITF